MRKAVYLLLTLVLWLGQVALLVHVTDLHAHSTGDTCEVCVHATPMGGALPSATLTLPLQRSVEAPLRLEHRATAAAPLADALARGPPAFS